MKKLQTSKVFLALITTAAVGATAVYLYLLCKTERDLSDYTTVVCSMRGAWAAYTGFYQWKAKCENRAKYAQQFINKLAGKYGIDAIAPIVQSIIED